MGQQSVLIHGSTVSWPNASNTGPSGSLTTDTRTSITVSSDNTVIQNLNFTAGVTISINSGVKGTIIRNNRMIVHGFWAVDDAGINTYIGYNYFDCSSVPAGNVSVGLACGGGARTSDADRCVYEFNNIFGSQDGIKAGQYHTINDNYIHDLGVVPGDSHNDCIQFQDYINITCTHNWLESPDTSCIIMGGGESRPRCENILVQDNHFQGGIYCLYGPQGGSVTNPPSVNVQVLDNHWSTAVWPNGGANGSNTAWEAGLGNSNVWSGNVWDDGPNAGLPVDPSG